MQVKKRKLAHKAFDSRHGLRNGERSVIGSAEHDEAASALSLPLLIPYSLPALRILLDKGARDQTSHRMRDQMHRVTGFEPSIYLCFQFRRSQLQIFSPVEPEGPHVPVLGKRKKQFAIVALHDAACAY